MIKRIKIGSIISLIAGLALAWVGKMGLVSKLIIRDLCASSGSDGFITYGLSNCYGIADTLLVWAGWIIAGAAFFLLMFTIGYSFKE